MLPTSAGRPAGLLAQPPRHAPGRDLDAGRKAELLQDVGDMGGDRCRAHVEPARHRRIAETARDQIRDLLLTPGQLCCRRGDIGSGWDSEDPKDA
jgi:hypothetical protein